MIADYQTVMLKIEDVAFFFSNLTSYGNYLHLGRAQRNIGRIHIYPHNYLASLALQFCLVYLFHLFAA